MSSPNSSQPSASLLHDSWKHPNARPSYSKSCWDAVKSRRSSSELVNELHEQLFGKVKVAAICYSFWGSQYIPLIY